MVNKAINSGDRHRRIREDLFPFTEWLITSDNKAPTLITLRDEFKKHGCFGLVFADIAEIIEDQAIEAIELGQGCGQGKVAPGGLQTLNQVGGARELDAVTAFNQGGA